MTAPHRRLRNPKTEGEFDAPMGAVDTYRRAGWVPVDELDQQSDTESPDRGGELPPASVEPASTSGQPEPVTTESPRGRRSTKKEEG